MAARGRKRRTSVDHAKHEVRVFAQLEIEELAHEHRQLLRRLLFLLPLAIAEVLLQIRCDKIHPSTFTSSNSSQPEDSAAAIAQTVRKLLGCLCGSGRYWSSRTSRTRSQLRNRTGKEAQQISQQRALRTDVALNVQPTRAIQRRLQILRKHYECA